MILFPNPSTVMHVLLFNGGSVCGLKIFPLSMSMNETSFGA